VKWKRKIGDFFSSISQNQVPLDLSLFKNKLI